MTPLEKLKAAAALAKAANSAAVQPLPLPDTSAALKATILIDAGAGVGKDVCVPVAAEPTVDPRMEPILKVMRNIEAQLQRENPKIENYMVEINQNLRSFPDLIHLLTDEQIAPYYKAVLKQSNIKLAPKKSKAAAKEVIELTDDIFGLGNLGSKK